jgi:hypothetical protein
MKHRLEIIHLVSFNPTLKTPEIHNFFVHILIWSIQVALASYDNLLCSNSINYNILHNFIVRYLLNLCLLD